VKTGVALMDKAMLLLVREKGQETMRARDAR